eukprot:gene29723-biopygen4343
MDPAIATPGNAALALRHGDDVFFTATEVADGKHSAVLRAGDPSHPVVGATLTLGVQAYDALRISQTDVLFRTTAHMQSNLIVRDSLVVQNGAISVTNFDNLVDDFITNSLILPPTANALATAYVTLSNLIVSRVASASTGGANNESYYGSRIPTGSETMQMGSIACAYMDQPPSAYALNMAYVQLSNYVQTKLATLNTTLSVMEGYGGNTSTSNNSIQLPSDGMWQTDMWLQSADGTDRMLFHTGGGTEFPSQRYTWRAQEVGTSFLDIEPGVGMTLHEGTLFAPSVDVAGPLSVAGSLVVSGPDVDFRQVECLRIPTGNVEAGTVFANHYCNLPTASSVQRGVVQIAASRNQLLDAYSSNVAVSASLFAAANSNIDSRVTNATVLVTEALYAATESYQRSINDTQRIVRDYYTNEPVECIKMTSHASNAGDVMSLMLINDTDESVKLDIYPDAAGSEASLVATKGLMIRESTAAEIDIGSVVRVRTGPDAARIIPEGPEFALTPGFEATSSSTYAPDSWSAPYQAFSDTPLATSWISKLGAYTSDSGAPTSESALTNTLSLVGDAPISVHGEWVQLNFPSVLYVHSVFIACSSMNYMPDDFAILGLPEGDAGWRNLYFRASQSPFLGRGEGMWYTLPRGAGILPLVAVRLVVTRMASRATLPGVFSTSVQVDLVRFLASESVLASDLLFSVGDEVAPTLRVSHAGSVGVRLVGTPSAALHVGNALEPRTVVLFDNDPDLPNDHEFRGFGISPAALTMRVEGPEASFSFEAGRCLSNSDEVASISGSDGTLSTGGSLRFAGEFRHTSSQHAFIIDNGDFMAGPLVMPDAHRDTVLIRDSNTYVTIGGRLSFVNNYGSNVDLDSASNIDLDSASNLDSVNREDSNALLVLDWNTVSSPCGNGMLGTPEVPWASIAGRDQLYLQDGRLLGAAISDLTWNDASLPMVDRNHGLPWADVHAGHRCHHIGSSSTRFVKDEASSLFNLHLPGEVTLAIGGADAVLGYSLSSSSSRHVVVDILVAASGAIRVAVLPGDIWTWEEDPRTEAAVTLWRVQLADKSPYVESMEAVLEVVVADDGGGSIIEGSEGGGIWETDPDHLVLMFKTKGGYYGEGQVRWKKTGAAHPFTLIPPANTSLHTSVVLSISFDEVSWGRALGTASAAYMDLRVACSSDLFALSIQASGSVWVRDCVNASALVVDDVSLSGDGGVVWAVLPAGASFIVWSRKVGAALSVDCLFDEEDESLIVALHFGTFSTHFEMVTFDQSLSSSVVALPASGENVVVASQSSPRTPGNALMFRGMCNAVLGTYSEVRLASSLLLSIRGDSSFPGLVWLAGSDQLEVPENAVAVIGCDNNSSTCTSAWMNVVSLHNCSLDRAIMAAGIADSGLFMLMVSIKDIVDPRAVRIGCSSSSYSGNRSFSIEYLCSGTGGGGVLALQLPGHSSSLKLPGAAMEALGGVYLSGNRQVFSPSVGGAGLVLAAPDADVGIVASGDVHLRSTLGRVRISSDIVAERDCRVLGSSCFLGPTSFEAPSAFNEELVVDGDLFVNRSMSVRGSVFLDGPVSMAPLGPPVRLSDNALTEVGQIVFRDDGRGFSLVGGTYADEEDPRLLFEGLSHQDTAQRYYGRAQMGEVGGGQSLVDAAWMYADGMETRDRTVGTFLRLSESIKLHAGQKLRASVDASGGVLVLANDGDSRFPLTVSGDAPSDLVQAAFGSSISRPPVALLPSYTGVRLETRGGDLVILGGEGGGVMQVSDVGVALDLNPAGGLVRVNGVPIQPTSDGRQKTNRSDLLGTSSADILRRLRPCTYTHRGVVEAGFIAQEVFCEVPEMRHLISLPRDFEIDDDNTLGNAPVGSVGLNYVGIIAYLVSAMQEQVKKIEDLQARIAKKFKAFTSNIVNAPYPPLSGIRAQSGTSGLPTLSFSNSPDTGLFNPSVGTLGVVAGGAELVRVSNNVSVLADIVVSSNIIPVKNATQHIGSSNMHFKEAWIDTLHISSNTLYVGDTLVLGTDAHILAMSAGPGQGISITTTGAGETSLVSEEGVNVTSVGGVTMHVTGVNKVVHIQSTGAGGIVQLGATKEVVLTAPITTVSSNLTVNGTNFTAGIRAKSGSAGAPSLSFSNATDTGLFNPGAGMLGVAAGGRELVRVSNTVSVMGDLVVSSNIIPSANATQYIGSSTMHFKEAWIDTLHISSNTLYIGDTPVLGTDDQTVSIRADPGQGISITTTGVGETSLVSESGVNVVSGGGVNMQVTGLNKVVDIQSSGAGGTVQLGATKEVVMTAPLTTVSNNLTVSGNLTVNGSNFTVNTQTVTVEDNIIVLNSGEIGPGVTKGEAGITIDRGDALDYQLLFRESDDKFVMGLQGSLAPIATETFAANAGNISTGVLGVTMGGTGVSASTGTGSNVLRDNATMSNLTTIGGMISSNGSGLTALNANNISSGTLPVVRGGTGVSVSTGSGSNVLSDNATMSYLNIVGGIYQNGVPFKVGGGFDDGTVGFPSITFTSDSNTGLYRLGADTIGISTGGVSRVTILDNGNVGFGTNAPVARLHVVGDGYFNGNVIATSNIIGFSTMESDSNVKHHFEPITDALDKIDAIGAYTFEYRGDDSRKRHAGVIAQQVQRVLPEVVDVHPLKDTLTVAYGNLSSLLLAGVQELRDEVNNLKEELKEIRYLRGFYSEVVFVSSDVDGREYLMRRLPDRQNAANLMARINLNLNKLVQHLVAKYPKNPVVRQLYDNYNPDALSEGGAELGYTSYSVNKGEKIVLCLRQRDHELVEENILMYVAIHELGHLATDEVGHTPKFWSNFKWILGEAMSIGLYTKVDFDNEPQKYCGINITSSIV